MQPSVTIKSDTVEEAIQTALSILGATIDEVDIAVLSSPTKGIFGGVKSLAEVKITKLTAGSIEESITEQLEKHIEQSERKSTVKREEVEETEAFGVWIVDGELHIHSSKSKYPIIEVGSGVQVFINGMEVKNRQIVASDDRVEIRTQEETIPSTFSVELEEQNMKAYLVTTPGKRIKRRVMDKPIDEFVVIEAEEHHIPVINISMDAILEKVGILKIPNVDYSAIAHAIQQTEPQKVLLTAGVAPVQGKNGYLNVLYDNEVFQSVRSQKERVNFREKNSILTVGEGDVIAQIVPPEKGKPGRDIFGDVVLPNPVLEVDLRLTKHVALKDANIIATVSGRPLIETRGRLVKVDVVKELIHYGDVSMDSGNIRFQGDVTIKGDVEDSMVVEAAGRILIEGNITKADISSAQSVQVKKNVFSSSINVGKANIVVNELVLQVKGLIPQFEQMRMAIRQLMEVNQLSRETLEVNQLHHLIRLLMEKKFPTMKEMVHAFVQKVRLHQGVLDKEWTEIAEKLHKHLLVLSTDTNPHDYSPLVEEVKDLYEMYCIPPEPKSNLSVAYAINSNLYCSGNIFITDQGVYHCNIQAGNNIRVASVCRGGQLIAGKQATFDELGSEVGVKTIVKVPSDGLIEIGHVFQGTEIQIGNRRHTFGVEEYHVKAHLNSDGMIELR